MSRSAYTSEPNPVILDDIARIASSNLPWEQLRAKTVLVSGGGGFLAAYLVKSILLVSRQADLGTRVVCLVRNPASAHMRLSGWMGQADLTLLEHDVSLPLPKNLGRADLIVHAASQASPKYFRADPVGTLSANTLGTAHLLDHAAQSHAQRFLFFSSAEVYGFAQNADRPIGEHDYGYLDPLDVRSCYAQSKRLGETMCAAWAHQYGVHASIVRPFHTYGPGMALDDGRVFADFVADAVGCRSIALKSAGTATRCFCYIADATIAFLTVLLRGETAHAYNVGNPHAEISIRDLAGVITEIFPERCKTVRVENNTGPRSSPSNPVTHSRPDIAQITCLGWKPTVDIREGFRRTIQSFL